MNSWLKFLADGEPPLQWRHVSSPHNGKSTEALETHLTNTVLFPVVCRSFPAVIVLPLFATLGRLLPAVTAVESAGSSLT